VINRFDGEVAALRIIGRTIGMKAVDALKKRLSRDLVAE
jgi:hypothetical protein